MIIEQVVVNDLEAFRYNMLMSFVNFNNSVFLSKILIFCLIDPTINALVMQHKDNEFLVKLNHLFS
jgi:hypothetical protein